METALAQNEGCLLYSTRINMMCVVRCLFFCLFAFYLAGCAVVPSPEARLAFTNELASSQNWRSELIQADQFALTAYLPQRISPHELLTVYIEGDGLAWIDGTTPSYDPTPRLPLGLKLALAHPDGNAAYLARPCQFMGEAAAKRCGFEYWTNRRFAPEVIAATSVALDVLKQRFGAKQLKLVGYSGGGAVATLVAARRDDVVLLVTVAGNLDTQEWVRLHRISPLTGSLNPADVRAQLTQIRQVHFSGENDRVVPLVIAETFASGFATQFRPEIRVIKGYDHTCCWADSWASFWIEIQQ